MEIFGYIASVFIGITLGLIGGGGSILTVPVLTYLFGVDPVLATAYSLFIVGTTSLVGVGQSMAKGLVSYKTAIVFAVPSFIAVYLTRRYLVPAIPDSIFTAGEFEMTKSIAIMLFFAVIMLLASASMIRDKRPEAQNDDVSQLAFNYPMILLEGAVVGVVTGLVGAGGGFLIIPALVVLAKLPMKLAVGTSLLIIAVKSLFGFAGDLGTGASIDWRLMLIVTALSVGGIFLGGYLSSYIDGKKLKAGFGWFVLVMGVYIIAKEILSA